MSAGSKAIPLSATPKAIEAIEKLLEKRKPRALGIRIGLDTAGCSGLRYSMEFVDEDTFDAADDVVSLGEAVVFVEAQASFFLFGTQIDFKEDDLQEGFIFLNPHEKSRCGCGDSFHV